LNRSTRHWLVAAWTLALVAGAPGFARAQITHPLYSCSNRLAGNLREFAAGLVDAVASCATDRLRASGTGACASTPAVLAKIETFAETFADDLTRCTAAEIDTICAFREKTIEGLVPAVTSAEVASSVRNRLVALVQDLFETPFEGCVRPVSPVSTPVAECADKIRTVLSDQGDALSAEYFSCELRNLANSLACVDPEAGDPNSDDLENGIAGVLGDVDAIANRCNDAEVEAIGCPLGARTVEGLLAALRERLGEITSELNLEVFHSPCRDDADESRPPLVAADATLEPSMRKVKVSCGQVLGSSFFGTDRTLNFDSDLDCSPARTATDGIVVAKAGVKITGRGKTWAITGPSTRKLRTGAAIRLAQGAYGVKILGFRRIQYFGTGIAADLPSNRRLRVANTVFFRNIDAGLRSVGQRTRVVESIADRNGIGFDLSGDGSSLSRSSVRRSEPQAAAPGLPLSPGIGLRLGGLDRDGNGQSVRIFNTTSSTENVIGVQMNGEKGLVEGIVVHSNLSDGLQVGGAGNVVRDVSVKMNGGNGVAVTGVGSRLESVGSDENGWSGFDISGADTVVSQCGAGSPADKGNGLDGFHVSGAGTVFDTNRAEANVLTGFAILAPVASFKGNKSQGNLIGFIFDSTGNLLEANSAEFNAGDEYRIAPSNLDGTGNKANGATFSFGSAGLTIH